MGWARYFLPMRFQNGQPMLKKIGEIGNSDQLVSQAKDLFKEIDTNGNDTAEWEEITSFLDGAQIAYDKDLLTKAFKDADVDGDNTLSLAEFIEAMKVGAIANIFCIPTDQRQIVLHHDSLKDEPCSKKKMQRSPGISLQSREKGMQTNLMPRHPRMKKMSRQTSPYGSRVVALAVLLSPQPVPYIVSIV